MTKIFVWIINIALFMLLLVFALNNLEPVTVKFAASWQWEMPMIVLILIVFAIGCVIGMIAMLPFAWRVRKQAKRDTKKALQTQQTNTAPTNSSIATGTQQPHP